MAETPCAGYNRNISDGKQFHCHTPAVVTIVAGCIHEHIGPRDLCAYHAAEVRAAEMNCGYCLEAEPPHRCYLTAHSETAVTP